MTTLCFLDTETTSLRHDRRAWEIGLILRYESGAEAEHTWMIDPDDLDLGNADLMSLKIGKFFERHPSMNRDVVRPNIVSEYEAMLEIEYLTRNMVIVGAVPWFDTDVLGQRMRERGVCPSWHYHLVDVETLAAGALRMPPPWNFDSLLKAADLEYDEAARHTALGDARMALDLYDAVMMNGLAFP